MNKAESGGEPPEPNEGKSRSFTGVRKNPDGTLDYSHAAEVLSPEGESASPPDTTEGPLPLIREYFETYKHDPSEYGAQSHNVILDKRCKELERLANPQTQESVTPRDAAPVLAWIADRMTNANLYTLGGEADHLCSKKLFTENCAIVYPDAKVDIHDDLRATVARLRLVAPRDTTALSSIADGPNPSETRRLLKENPRQLARQIDEALSLAGMWAGTVEHETRGQKVDPVRHDTAERQLTKAVEEIYKLQLMRDQLQEQIYGRADITPSEARRMDALRAEVRGAPESAPTPKDKAAQEQPSVKSYRPMSAAEIQQSKAHLDASRVVSQTRQAEARKQDERQPEQETRLEGSPALSEAALRDKKIELGKNGPFAALREQHKTNDEVKKSVTPEMKRLLLEKLLKDIDFGVRGAEKYVKEHPEEVPGHPNFVIGRKNVAQFAGLGVTLGDAAVYQKIAIATEGRDISPDKVALMPMVDYLKRYLGYDLREDKKRAELLNKFTNALL